MPWVFKIKNNHAFENCIAGASQPLKLQASLHICRSGNPIKVYRKGAKSCGAMSCCYSPSPTTATALFDPTLFWIMHF